jgi:hypothetical protein
MAVNRSMTCEYFAAAVEAGIVRSPELFGFGRRSAGHRQLSYRCAAGSGSHGRWLAQPLGTGTRGLLPANVLVAARIGSVGVDSTESCAAASHHGVRVEHHAHRRCCVVGSAGVVHLGCQQDQIAWESAVKRRRPVERVEYGR